MNLNFYYILSSSFASIWRQNLYFAKIFYIEWKLKKRHSIFWNHELRPSPSPVFIHFTILLCLNLCESSFLPFHICGSPKWRAHLFTFIWSRLFIPRFINYIDSAIAFIIFIFSRSLKLGLLRLLHTENIQWLGSYICLLPFPSDVSINLILWAVWAKFVNQLHIIIINFFFWQVFILFFIIPRKCWRPIDSLQVTSGFTGE